MLSNKKNAQFFPYLQTNLNAVGKKALFPDTGIIAAREYFCCQTGIADFIYKNRLSFSGYDYQELYLSTFLPAIQQILSHFHAEGISYLIGHTHKEIVVVFQLLDPQYTAMDVASEIDACIRRLSEEHLPLKNSRYCNTTALSDPVTGIDGIQTGCVQTEKLKRLSFFRMTPGVITAERLSSLKNHATYRDVMTLTRQLCQAASQGEDSKTLALAEKLFLDLLKHSYDMELVHDALSHIKYFFTIRLNVHCPDKQTDLTSLCSASSYIVIEECCDAILPVLTGVCNTIRRNGIWSDAVAYAAYYLRSNLDKDISLPEIAAFADTAPAYLSNLFHQQTGMTIKQYQQKIRLEHACFLLKESEEKVSVIAAKAGFLDRRYFTRIFKEAYGVTPQQFRAQEQTESS